MVKKLQKLWLLMILVFTVAAVMSLSAMAEESRTRVDCAPVPLDGEWHDYVLEKDTFAWCPLQLAGNGRLDLSVQTSFESSSSYSIELLDENCETVCRISQYSDGPADPTVWTTAYDLTAGQYFVRVESWNGLRGPFRVKAGFTPSRGEEQTGDTFETAAELTAPEVLGFLSSKQTDAFYAETLPENSQNFVDCFRLNVEADTFDFSVTPVDPEGNFRLTIYDAGYQQVDCEYNNPAFSIDLADGLYYLCVEADGNLCGDYVLKIDWAGRAETNTENNADAAEHNADARLQNLSVSVGGSLPLCNEEAERADVRWGSTDPLVAVGSQDGMIIGMSAGVVYIAAVPGDGTAATVYRVTVQ